MRMAVVESKQAIYHLYSRDSSANKIFKIVAKFMFS